MPSRRLTLAGFLVTILVCTGHAAAPPAVSTDLYGDPLPPGAVGRMGSVQWRTGRQLSKFALLPDGKYVASPCRDTVTFLDLRTGRIARTIHAKLPGVQNGFIEVVFSPDGKYALSADFPD